MPPEGSPKALPPPNGAIEVGVTPWIPWLAASDVEVAPWVVLDVTLELRLDAACRDLDPVRSAFKSKPIAVATKTAAAIPTVILQPADHLRGVPGPGMAAVVVSQTE